MKVLLDTHILLWLSADSSKLSDRVKTIILEEQNSLFLSLASIWELQIKSQLGKLSLTRPLPDLLKQQCETNDINLLPIALEHIFTLNDLPHHHRDPFDRLLLAQSKFEKMPILSIDSIFDAYEVERIW